MTYYNTTRMSGSDLSEAKKKAASQDAIILEFFQAGGSWTPSEVNRVLLQNTPITSVRRSITNLTEAGLLVKTEEQRMGPYKRPEYVWRIRYENDPNQADLF